MSIVIDPLQKALEETSVRTDRHMVVIYDNDHTPLNWVVAILIDATGCDKAEAEIECWEAQEFGKAAVHFDSESNCDTVAAKIRNVGVQAEVVREWNLD